VKTFLQGQKSAKDFSKTFHLALEKGLPASYVRYVPTAASEDERRQESPRLPRPAVFRSYDSNAMKNFIEKIFRTR